jgi:hypothetical protein
MNNKEVKIMTNQNRGKEYNPTRVYCRKLLRSYIKNKIEKDKGFHKVNPQMSKIFHKMREN